MRTSDRQHLPKWEVYGALLLVNVLVLAIVGAVVWGTIWAISWVVGWDAEANARSATIIWAAIWAVRNAIGILHELRRVSKKNQLIKVFIEDTARALVEEAVTNPKDKWGMHDDDYTPSEPDDEGVVALFHLDTHYGGSGATESCVFPVVKTENGYQGYIKNHIMPWFRGLKGEWKPSVQAAVESLLCCIESNKGRVAAVWRYRG